MPASSRIRTLAALGIGWAIALSGCASNTAVDRPATPKTEPCPAAPACRLVTPAEQQVEGWLAAMTEAEKIALVAGTGFDTVGVPRLHIPALRMTDGPMGVRQPPSTLFAAGVLLAATFDPALAERVGAAIARETKGHGKNVILGPAVNITRTALNGRNFEYFGEDPELAARMAVAYVRGVQSQGVMATVKHFAANNQETERLTISAELDARTLHEIYLPAFEAAVREASVWAVMCAYNRLNGVYACENPDLLNAVLRRDWGFGGLVMSDWGATHSTAPAMQAGLDLEMPRAEFFSATAIQEAVAAKRLDRGVLDQMVRRQLRAIVALRLDEDASPHPEAVDTLEHRALNREVARAGYVLLKNDGSLLPLDRNKLRRIAVVGPRGDAIDHGGGSAEVSATRKVTLVQGLRQALGEKVRIDFVPGESTPERFEPIPAAVLSSGGKKGLRGEYFANKTFSGQPTLVRVDPVVDFHYDLAAPAPGLPSDNFSIRWTGKLTPRKSGRYALGVRSDDGARLYVDERRVLDNWGDHAPTLKVGELDLVAGKAYDVRLEYFESGLGASVELLWQQVDKEPLRHVVEVARTADVVIAAVGDGADDETEGQDRKSLSLPGHQNEIVQAALSANPRVVVVTTAGAAVAMPWLGKTPAVLHAWFPGQEAGLALADVLLGAVSPSAKLPVSFPRRFEDEPAFGHFPGSGGKVLYEEGLLVGYRWYDTRKVEPLFPFGHGLSYTTFAYSELTGSAWEGERGATVRLKVKNTGARRGAEIVQIYVHANAPQPVRPEQELKAFAKVDLAPGEERAVTLALPPRAFSTFHPKQGWRVEPGPYEVRVGSSSRDIRLRTSIVVPAP